MAKKKKYSKEFKVEAVRLVKEQGVPYRQAAENLGVAAGMLVRWAKELAAKGEHAFLGKGKLPPDEQAIRQLQEEVRRLRMERDILKKAMAYFAKQSE